MGFKNVKLKNSFDLNQNFSLFLYYLEQHINHSELGWRLCANGSMFILLAIEGKLQDFV